MVKMQPWSASSIDAFCTCPMKYHRLRILRDVQDLPPSDETLYGRRLHKAFENAVNLGEPLPSSFAQCSDLVDKIKALPGEKMAEHRFMLDESRCPCGRSDAWVTGVADLVVKQGGTVAIIDYKTGKRRPSDQLKLYAAMAFATWPEVSRVNTVYLWLKTKQIDRDEYAREDAQKLWAAYTPLLERYKIALTTDAWPAKPSGLCKCYCPVRDCKYCGI